MNEANKFLFVGDTVPSKPFVHGRSLKKFCIEHDIRGFNLESSGTAAVSKVILNEAFIRNENAQKALTYNAKQKTKS